MGDLLLGGPLSAVLLALSFQPYQTPVLAWVALVPLLLSLARHQDRPGLRFVHGLLFGWTLSAWSLSWFFHAFLASLSGLKGRAGPGALLSAAFGCGVYWTLLALFPALFSLAAGPALRNRKRVLAGVTLPVLWCGLEVLRGPCCPVPSVWVSNWLSLGYALRPEAPEAQAASIVGVHGLSFAIALANSAFFLALREGRWPLQGLFVLLGCLIPLLLRSYGLEHLPGGPLRGTFPVAVVAQERPDLEGLLRLSSARLEPPPRLILGPDLPALKLASAGAGASWRAGLSPELTQKLRSPLVLAAEIEPRGREGSRTGALLLGPEGELTPLLARRFPGTFIDHEPDGKQLNILDSTGAKIGLGLGFDLDFPAYARQLAAEGSTFLASSARDLREWGEKAVQQHAALELFRAVENRRWLARTSGSGAFIADPHGRKVLELLSGFDSAGAEKIELLTEQSLYTRGGWWLEPLLLLGALTLLGYGLGQGLGHGLRYGRGRKLLGPGRGPGPVASDVSDISDISNLTTKSPACPPA